MRRDIEFLSGGVTLRGFFEVPMGPTAWCL